MFAGSIAAAALDLRDKRQCQTIGRRPSAAISVNVVGNVFVRRCGRLRGDSRGGLSGFWRSTASAHRGHSSHDSEAAERSLDLEIPPDRVFSRDSRRTTAPVPDPTTAATSV